MASARAEATTRRRSNLLLLFTCVVVCLGLLVHNFPSSWNIPGLRIFSSSAVRGSTGYGLQGRDDYSCSAEKPCSNGACCGASGYCGYGPTYCGDGCVSQCDAVAECGQYSETGNKTCPLNVCCSEYGFCGTTEEFCSGGCQSNCELHPSPPDGASTDDVYQRVIGYYEAWSARRDCHPMAPDGLPIDGLTHVNFAFAYIDPDTYEVTTMDSATPADLFRTTADVKTFKTGNAELEVFVSIGGWTFSDNDTTTQPLFGEIAADSSKRQTFANNVVRFLDQYGFDGIDIDWEYPGAGDRGGKEGDTENYVLLLKTLRETFDKSPRSLGLTFTIPSSYWYLRWFDLPGMVKYADWINLMSYDLHGFWDRKNPIGSIVQGHTNLTEIKSSMELLWRVGIPPAKVVMGVGFYGRSFQLADPACTKPGCAFGGAANPGECTNTAGILGYFEIMDILNGATTSGSKKRSDKQVTLVHEEEDAVNYLVYDDDQWVSFDNNVTFQQKVDWANGIGLGGLMIWSSDMDDKQFTGLQGLLGKPVGGIENPLKNAKAVAQDWAGQNGQQCNRFDQCVDMGNPQASGCGTGQVRIGYDAGGCGSGYGKPICCPSTAYPKSCLWRGGGSDCNGQCHSGEMTLLYSSWGGDPTEGNHKRCGRGRKAFCCVAEEWESEIEDCYLGNCGGGCSAGDEKVASVHDPDGCAYPYGGSGPQNRDYCCRSPAKFTGCHWVGKGDCADNTCDDNDIQLMVNSYGDSKSSCNWGRQKALCCNAPAEQAFLPVDLKDIFPTLPPSNDYVKYDLQFPKGASRGSNPVNTAFGWVLIDGPEAAVTSAKVKRDGSKSDLEFLNCHEIQGEKRQKVRFVCTNDGPTSDCEHMMLDGVAGTIIEMPNSCGAATYAVAHEVSVAEDQSLPAHLSHLKNVTVKELTFDYNFGLVKRDAGSIYFRADYANIGGYWETVVDSSPASKRSMIRRFYSSSDADWGNRFATVRNEKSGSGSSFSKTFSQSIFSGLKACGSAKAFADIVASGSISATAKMAVSIVGTISPTIDIEEVYSFVDTNIDAKMNLDMSMYGAFNLDYTTESLFSSPISMDEFNHIGIISFAPTLMADVGMVADIELAGNLSTGVHAYTSTNIVQNFPHDAGDSSGQTAQEAMDTKFSGNISDAAEGTIKIDLRPRVGLSITLNKYGTDGNVINAFAEASLDTYNAIQIHSNKSYDVTLGTGPATTIVTYKNSLDSFTSWSEDSNMDRVIGSANEAKVIASGAAGGGDDEGNNNKGGPSPHTISNDTSSLFWDSETNFLGCPTGLVLVCDSLDENPQCTIDICQLYPGICDDYDTIDGGYDGSFDGGTGSGNSTTNSTLTKRSSLAKRGAEREFKVLLADNTYAEFKSLPYPSIGKLHSGANGAVVIDTAFDFASQDCDDFDTLDWPIDDVDLSQFVTEHIVELQTVKAWVQAANSGNLPSGGKMSVGAIPSTWWKNNFGSPVLSTSLAPVAGSYAPITPSDRVFNAMGSSRNRAVFVPCQKEINSMKALLWDFKAPDLALFNTDLADAINNCGPIEKFLKPLKVILAAYDYLVDPDVNDRFTKIVNAVDAQLTLIETDPNGVANLSKSWNEFIPDYMTKVVKHGRALMTSRITLIQNAYNNAANQPANMQTVMAIVKEMEAKAAKITAPYSTV